MVLDLEAMVLLFYSSGRHGGMEKKDEAEKRRRRGRRERTYVLVSKDIAVEVYTERVKGRRRCLVRNDLVVHKSKKGAIDKQKALGVRATRAATHSHKPFLPFHSWELQRHLANPVPIASSTTSAARSAWAPSAAPPSTSSKVSTTPQRAPASSARRKPSDSTRRALAAASPSGVASSPPSTAPWSTSARRKTHGTQSSPALPPEASLPCARALPHPHAPPRSAASSSRSSRAPVSCSTSSSARSNRCLSSSTNPCPVILRLGFRVSPLLRRLRIRRRNHGSVGCSVEIRKRNPNRVGEARPRFWRVLMPHLCPITITSEIGFGWVKKLRFACLNSESPW